MAFICTLDGQTYDHRFFRDGSASVVVSRIGYDPDDGVNWFVHVGLDVSAGGMLEYYFRLWRINAYDGEETQFNSGRETIRIIVGKDRTRILEAIVSATSLLISRVRPESFYRVTYDADLPRGALEKHLRLSELFEELGYFARRSEEFHGQRLWWMELAREDGC